jgi:hypothetical protein
MRFDLPPTGAVGTPPGQPSDGNPGGGLSTFPPDSIQSDLGFLDSINQFVGKQTLQLFAKILKTGPARVVATLVTSGPGAAQWVLGQLDSLGVDTSGIREKIRDIEIAISTFGLEQSIPRIRAQVQAVSAQLAELIERYLIDSENSSGIGDFIMPPMWRADP